MHAAQRCIYIGIKWEAGAQCRGVKRMCAEYTILGDLEACSLIKFGGLKKLFGYSGI